MEITSSAFKDQGKIPIQFVMPGTGRKNISIPIRWKNPPSGTKPFALSIMDPHPVAQNWVHWLVINIPKEVISIAEGAMNDPAASSGVSPFLLSRHSVLDTESSRVFWIPASAGMTNSRQAAGNEPEGIQIADNSRRPSISSKWLSKE